ncbi:unnamed protein product [Adineta steineri]|uniref:Uncharacterized protein n=1 Tax=Adineta steineri TaxID=433720 RepID=A0A815J886_9BILA|nr:unnamed protein product [Adineta steineri]
MAPELVVAFSFLLVSILVTVSGPIGIGIGIAGLIIVFVLRYTARPRIERWIEQREFARYENFLKWHPSEVARLTMTFPEENEIDQNLLYKFELKKLSGKAIKKILEQERQNTGQKLLETKLYFLNEEQLKTFRQNLNVIFGHFDISKEIEGNISITYEGHRLSVPSSDENPVTVHQLLSKARLNWQIDFKKGEWLLSTMEAENLEKKLIAAFDIPDSINQIIQTMPKSSTELELSYIESSRCTLS